MLMPRRILIVDDEPAVTQALHTLLTQAGYEVGVAHSGSQALQSLTPPPDLILLDVMLPEMDGYEVCRRLRAQPPHIPIVMLTARNEPIDKLLGLELGADLYLTKPFAPPELLAHLKAMFRLLDAYGARGEGLPLTCGPLTLWDAQHRVEIDSRPIELTPKEYELLRVFMQYPNRAFGRETLLRQVWGYDFGGDSRTVDVHIQRLRAKIESDPTQPQLLCTVRGLGYRLVAPLAAS
jgi:two-component system alkaline phosphatase synthesis response regulator PhoP